jgi:hypothetical protein
MGLKFEILNLSLNFGLWPIHIKAGHHKCWSDFGFANLMYRIHKELIIMTSN